jgi:hypothetical protein
MGRRCYPIVSEYTEENCSTVESLTVLSKIEEFAFWLLYGVVSGSGGEGMEG